MSEEKKPLPKTITVPSGYTSDKLFITENGTEYKLYTGTGDIRSESDETWVVFEPGENWSKEAELKQDETMIYDPQEMRFVFIRRKQNGQENVQG